MRLFIEKVPNDISMVLAGMTWAQEQANCAHSRRARLAVQGEQQESLTITLDMTAVLFHSHERSRSSSKWCSV